MQLKVNLLSALFLVSACATAQNLKVNVQTPSIQLTADSAIVSMKMDFTPENMDSKGYIRITPNLVGDGNTKELPKVILNGKRAHRMFRRTQALDRRRDKGGDPTLFTAIEIDEDKETVTYRVSVPKSAWMQMASITLHKEVIDGKGNKLRAEILPVAGVNSEAFVQEETLAVPQNTTSVTPQGVVAETTVAQPQYQSSVSGVRYKGSYISPESDAIDERKQKEFNFSLDEARIMAEVNPQMLSLRELYTVATSMKNNPEYFYKIIDISVRVYPASPVANLNAAAAAIERGNTKAAGHYLQMASHETLAYKNCRGAYELMCNNTYEGIRLLKAAKAEGSEDAGQNLKIFFDSKQNKK